MRPSRERVWIEKRSCEEGQHLEVKEKEAPMMRVGISEVRGNRKLGNTEESVSEKPCQMLL